MVESPLQARIVVLLVKTYSNSHILTIISFSIGPPPPFITGHVTQKAGLEVLGMRNTLA
jgi:hypothetical protein